MKYNHYNNFKSIGLLLKNSPIMGKLFHKLQQLEQIKQIIPSFLPEVIKNHCNIANLQEGVLTLVTNSPAWKHQLNFLKMDLLEQLRKSSPLLAGLSSISIKIDYLQEDLYKYHDNINEYYKSLIKSNKNFNHNNHLNSISISITTAKLIENIITQEIKHQPLLDNFRRLLTKITK